MEKFNESMFGRKVKFTNAMAHEEVPCFYPEVGTIGTIVPTKGTDFENMDYLPYIVQWPEGTTSDKDLWAVAERDIELVDEEMEMYISKYISKSIFIDSFLKTLLSGMWGLDSEKWVVFSINSRLENKWFWSICLKNVETKAEKRIKIPMCRD